LGVGTTYGGTAGAWTASNKFGVTGQVNVVGTNGATFYITGVQLEVGSSATGFEYRQYQQELNLCQRYFYPFCQINGDSVGTGFCDTTTSVTTLVTFKVPMRTTPTLSYTATQYRINANTNVTATAVPTVSRQAVQSFLFSIGSVSGLTAGYGMVLSQFSDGYTAASAEL
jgi:hypothetical protein